MKALSIRQPWAWLIATGQKDVENRSWPTSFRGEFLVHAGKRFDHEGYRWIVSRMGIALPEPAEFERGGIVGVAEIADCVTQFNSPWFFGPYGFVIKKARPLRFAKLDGQLGFFDVIGKQSDGSLDFRR
jgi:hypothetical protein